MTFCVSSLINTILRYLKTTVSFTVRWVRDIRERIISLYLVITVTTINIFPYKIKCESFKSPFFNRLRNEK